MQLTVNGEPLEVDEPCSIAQLIARSERSGPTLAVELNGDVVPRESHEMTLLSSGDTVEIVTLVGGG